MRTILSLILATIILSFASCTDKIAERDERISGAIMDTIQAASKRLPIGQVDSIQLVRVDSLTTTEWAKQLLLLIRHEISMGKAYIDATNERIAYETWRLEKLTDPTDKQIIAKELQEREQSLKKYTTELATNSSKWDSLQVIANSGDKKHAGYLVNAKIKVKAPGESAYSWSTLLRYLVNSDVTNVIGANVVD